MTCRSIFLAMCIIAVCCTPALGAEEMLGKYEIELSRAASPQNATNALIAAAVLDGVQLQPGEVFSFNQTVGPRTAERGFVIGLITTRDKYLSDYGGGVCMTSSILNQAVKAANLTVLERHNHLLPSSYLPQGEDAAVYYGSEDFCFKNNSQYPLRIQAGQFDQALRIILWEVKPDKDVVIQVNGVPISTDTYFEIENGMAVVPVRTLTGIVGADIQWNSELKRAVVVKDESILELQVGSKQAFSNQKQVQLTDEPRISHGILMLPLQILADNLNFEANWDQSSKTISITYSSDTPASMLSTGSSTVKYLHNSS